MYFSSGSLQHYRDMEHLLLHIDQLKHFGKKLREWRQEAGITIRDLAIQSEISANTIARIERGEIDPKCGTAHKLWKALNDICIPF